MPDLPDSPATLPEHPTPPPVRRRGFGDGWLLSGRAAAKVLARPELVLVVIALASVEFLTGNLLPASGAAARAGLRPTAEPVAADQTFLRKWGQPYRKDPIGETLLGSGALLTFGVPLFDPAAAVTLLALERVPYFGDGRKAAPTSHAFIALCGFLAVAAVAFLPIFVCLLGWIRDAQEPLQITACPRYLRESYWPIAKGMLIFFGVAFASLLVLVIVALFVKVLVWWRTVNTDPFGHLAPLGLIPLTLAPFAVVAQRLGTRQGIAEGWRLLRANWPAVFALFLVLRVALEVVAVFGNLAPWPLTKQAGSVSLAAGPMAWSWAGHMGQVLIGLWLAYAFMEIAKETPAAVTETADG